MSRNDKAPLPLCGKERGLPLWIQKKEKGEKKENIYVTPKGRDSG